MAGQLLRGQGFIYLAYKLGKNTGLKCKIDAEERMASQKPLQELTCAVSVH